MIRLAKPSIESEDLESVREVLASGRLVQGSVVASFEEAIARYTGSEMAIATSNCTSALHLALMALEIGPGDDVLVPAYSWIATANVVELTGARPVFVDIDPDTYCMSVEALEKAIEQTDRQPVVKAVMPVHAFGCMADLERLCGIAEASGVMVIEDAACALGAVLDGRSAGTWGVAGCFSFHPRKTITTGEGGIVVTNDAVLANRLRALRNHGQDSTNPTPDFVVAGLNARMTEMQAALGLSQLAKLDRLLRARRTLAGRYNELLRHADIRTPTGVSADYHAVQAYVVLLPQSVDRDGVIAEMRGAGVETAIGTWLMPMTTYYRNKYGFRPGDFPAAEDVFRRSLALPLYESMTADEQDRVVNALLECICSVSAW